jgi:hypothetical protein
MKLKMQFLPLVDGITISIYANSYTIKMKYNLLNNYKHTSKRGNSSINVEKARKTTSTPIFSRKTVY